MIPPIDAVYTWVDGADPAHRAKRAAYGDRARETERWRDNDELRHSLRSLDRYAPWIRRIFIVTDGQVPDWLDTAHPRIEVVDHKAIFPDGRYLPSFNSCVIESFIHRIPGLAEHYLYLNDDFFLGAPVGPEDFLTEDGRQVFHLEHGPLPPLRDLVRGRLDRHSRLLAYCRLLLRATLGPGASFYDSPHTPQIYVKSAVAAVLRRYRLAVAIGRRRRFRSILMPLVRVLYTNTLLSEGDPARRPAICRFESGEFGFAALRDDGGGERGLLHIAQAPRKFFCINDDRRDAAIQPRLAVLLSVFLKHHFPDPSPFERRPGCEAPAHAHGS